MRIRIHSPELTDQDLQGCWRPEPPIFEIFGSGSRPRQIPAPATLICRNHVGGICYKRSLFYTDVHVVAGGAGEEVRHLRLASEQLVRQQEDQIQEEYRQGNHTHTLRCLALPVIVLLSKNDVTFHYTGDERKTSVADSNKHNIPIRSWLHDLITLIWIRILPVPKLYTKNKSSCPNIYESLNLCRFFFYY